MKTNIYKVYGREGHRLRFSFFKSVKFTDINGAKKYKKEYSRSRVYCGKLTNFSIL